MKLTILSEHAHKTSSAAPAKRMRSRGTVRTVESQRRASSVMTPAATVIPPKNRATG